MDDVFKRSWNCTVKSNQFDPTALEWLCWIGQPMLYDGGLCVNRSKEEHEQSDHQRGVLTV
jgi:hypothetical protein